MVDVVVADDAGLDRDLLAGVREMTFAAFEGRFDEHDWEHTFGGARVVALADGVTDHRHGPVPRLGSTARCSPGGGCPTNP